MKSIRYRFGKSLWFLLFLILLAFAFYYVDFKLTDLGEDDEFYKNIYFEAHGLLFDLIVFGVILSIYESLRSAKDKIRHVNRQPKVD